MKEYNTMRERIDDGWELWQYIAETQNNIINSGGKIVRDDRRIWHPEDGGWLHGMDNDDWITLLLAIEDTQERLEQNVSMYRKAFSSVREDTINQVKQKIMERLEPVDQALTFTQPLTYQFGYNRVMDIERQGLNNKPLAWKMTMTLREIWNDLHDIAITNEVYISKQKTFNKLFSIGE